MQLVERLGVLVRHYNKMGRALESTVQAHNEGAGSIESRLLVTGRERSGASGSPRDSRPPGGSSGRCGG